jgi:hypothetical protein
MNTFEFVKNFSSDDISSIVTRFFDEIMILYNLVGSRQDIDICTDNSASVATFILMMDSENDAQKLHDSLHNTTFAVYGDVFSIEMILTGASVTTTISRVNP